LCDFGSATSRTLEPDASREAVAEFEGDISHNTTLEFRAPEEVDLHLRMPVDEKVDVWALGCLLYRMCFNETPFGSSSMRILTANYTIPEKPAYSQALLKIIRAALTVHPDERPDVFQLYEMVCAAREISNKFTGQAKKRSMRPWPNKSPQTSPMSLSPTSPPPISPSPSGIPAAPVLAVLPPPSSAAARVMTPPTRTVWEALESRVQGTTPIHARQKSVPSFPSIESGSPG
jgi:serine/threonine protein kinase